MRTARRVLSALLFLGLADCGGCGSPDVVAITPTGSLKKNKTTQLGCSCQLVLNDNDVDGHTCRHPNGALLPPVIPERLPADKGVVFNVCLPPNLNLGLDAGAEALSDDEWARQADEYCTKTMAETTKDLFAYMSKRLCDGNCVDRVECVHQALPNSDSYTSDNPTCAATCDAVKCNYDNCHPDKVHPCDLCSIDLTQCKCTVITPFLERSSKCGVTTDSPTFCLKPPGNIDPPTISTGLLTRLLSAPNSIELDAAQSSAAIEVHFDDGIGATHRDAKTVHAGGSLDLFGFCDKGRTCDAALDLDLSPEDVTFNFEKVVCGATCVHDVDVNVARMRVVGGLEQVKVHIDEDGIGNIPAGALHVRADAIVSGIPDLATSRATSDRTNTQPLAFHVDFAAKTFSMPSVPFDFPNGNGTLRLVGRITNQPPRAKAGAAQVVECTSPSGSSVTLDGQGSADPDADIIDYEWWRGHALMDPSGGDSFASEAKTTVNAPFSPPKTTTTYGLSITDTHLAAGVSETQVTVEDTTPPTITLKANPTCLWAPNHKMVLYKLADMVSVNDVCDAAPDVRVAAVSSNEPATGGGSGWTSPDVRFGTDAFCVRAERAATDPAGRDYTVSVETRDASNNVVKKDVAVRVELDQGSGKCPKVDPSRLVADDDPRCVESKGGRR